MTPPRIGVTSGAGCDATGEPYDTPDAYVRALERAGAEPVLLPSHLDSLDDRLASLRGVLVTGGQDVAPERYGGRRLPSVQPADDVRDRFETRLAEVARDRQMPLLGICRGLQVATVAFGGTLVEDIAETYGDRAIAHRKPGTTDAERWSAMPGHVVAIEPDAMLAGIVRAERIVTNTIHHQSARVVPSDLRVVATTPDGVVEALEATFATPFFLLVQWHPELLEDEPSRRIFASFVRAAGTARSCRLPAVGTD